MRRTALFAFALIATIPAQAADKPVYSVERLLAAMPEPEQEYYVQNFDYAMLNLHGGQTHEWKSHESAGRFTVEAPFSGSGGAICRNYNQQLTVKTHAANGGGVACKRNGREGWCALRKTDVLTCALEPPDNSIEQILRDARESIDRVETKGRSAENAWDNWSPDWSKLW